MYSSSMQMGKHSRKRIFIGLLLISLMVLFLVFLATWWVVSKKTLLVNKVILTLLTAMAILLFVILCTGLAALVWSLWRSKTIPSLYSAMNTATNMLFPLALRLGKGLGMDEDRIKSSYIQVSNQLVKTRVNRASKRVMILAPHCLQWVECPHKITIDVNNCRGCGKCTIAALKDMAVRNAAKLVVVTGGTSARKIIKEIRPDAVVAIACERDLTSGIQDVGILPVLGVINERPQGPCYNTRVELHKVEEAVRYFQQGG